VMNKYSKNAGQRNFFNNKFVQAISISSKPVNGTVYPWKFPIVNFSME
jgi:hypothetical protein